MVMDQKQMLSILLVLLGDVAVIWILFWMLGAVIRLITVFMIAATLVALTILEIGFFAYVLGLAAIYLICEKHSSAEGSDLIIITLLAGILHFVFVVFFEVLVKDYVRVA